VLSRVLSISIVCVAVVAVSARQEPQPPGAGQAQAAAAQVQPDQLKVPVSQFEVLLRDALLVAVRRFAQWAQQVVPDVYVTQAASPTVHGILLPDGSVVYTIQQAELVGVRILNQTLQQRPAATPPPANGLPKVNAQNLVTADPMVAADPNAEGCARVTSVLVDANQKYTDCVREALINAMLDSSVLLPIKPGQSLHVADIPVDVAVNSVYSNPSRKLTLSIKGEDLKEFHDGKITRDQAKLRITELRY
jgi:hypothetical protein